MAIDGELWSMVELMGTLAFLYTSKRQTTTKQKQSFNASKKLLLSMDYHPGLDQIKAGKMLRFQLTCSTMFNEVQEEEV